MRKITVLGYEVPFSASNPSQFRSLCEAEDKMLKCIADIPEEAAPAESMERQISAVHEFFSSILGPKNSSVIMNTLVDLHDCLEAYKEVMDEVKRQTDETETLISSIFTANETD